MSNKIFKEGFLMPYQMSKFTLRIENELLKKFRFVAKYNDRSANQEIITLIRKHIREFEKKNGKIVL